MILQERKIKTNEGAEYWCVQTGAALDRFDRLLQIGPRAERGPAFFFQKATISVIWILWRPARGVILLMQSHVCTQPVSAQQSNQ